MSYKTLMTPITLYFIKSLQKCKQEIYLPTWNKYFEILIYNPPFFKHHQDHDSNVMVSAILHYASHIYMPAHSVDISTRLPRFYHIENLINNSFIIESQNTMTAVTESNKYKLSLLFS